MEVYAGLPRAHRPPRRPGHRRARGARRPRQHAGLLHHRRQRRLRRRHVQRRVQRDGELQRRGGHRDARVHGLQDRRARHADAVQPLRRRLGVGDGHPVPVDQAGRLALGRHPQRHHRALAGRHHRKGEIRSQFCHVIDVAPTVLEAAGLPEPAFVNGVQQSPHRRHQHAVRLRRRRGAGAPRPAVLRDVRQPRHLLQGLERRHQAQHPVGADRGRLPAFDDDVWELYDGTRDWTQSHDLAGGDAGQAARSCSGCG